MLSTLRHTFLSIPSCHQNSSNSITAKALASLSGLEFKPLEPRYANLKRRLISGREDAIRASWDRLLAYLREKVAVIASLGSKVIPDIDFSDLDNASQEFKSEHSKRGVAIIRNVIPLSEALEWKEDLRRYIADNPHTKAFPTDNPQVYELYWSATQMRVRLHPNMLSTQRFLMSFWHHPDETPISLQHPTAYADRLRMRQPGDARFALGPHVDGGSVERWEESGYGLGGVYDRIFEGRWEDHDPWEAGCRLPVKSDLYQGVGVCSMFRMAQGWLSMSNVGPFEGTLLVNPLL